MTKPGEFTVSKYRAHLAVYAVTGGFPEILTTIIDKKS